MSDERCDFVNYKNGIVKWRSVKKYTHAIMQSDLLRDVSKSPTIANGIVAKMVNEKITRG